MREYTNKKEPPLTVMKPLWKGICYAFIHLMYVGRIYNVALFFCTRLILHGYKNAGVAVVGYQGVLATSSLGVLNKRPLAHEITMRHDTGQLACDGTVNGFCDLEICGEQNIKVTLVNLRLVRMLTLSVAAWRGLTKGVVTGTILL